MLELADIAHLLRWRAGAWPLAMLASVGFAVGAVEEGERPSLMEVASGYGFSESDVDTMLSGKVVFGDLEAVSDNELALSAGTLSRQTVDWHFKQINLAITASQSDPTLEGSAALEGDGQAGLAKLLLDDESLDRLARVEAGTETNFSSAEIAKLREAGRVSDPIARRAAVLEAFRGILAERYQSYLARGLAGLAPYDRGDGEATSPGAQLERAFGELRLTRQLAPTVHGAMASFPADVPEGVRSRFLWMINHAEDRTLVTLAHELIGIENGNLVEIVRRFYVDHTLNSMQTVSVSMPVGEGTAILYANRTSTDLVTGFGSSIAKGIGTFLMRREVGRLVDAFLGVTEKNPKLPAQ